MIALTKKTIKLIPRLSRRDRIALEFARIFMATNEYSDMDAIRQAAWCADVLILELRNVTA